MPAPAHDSATRTKLLDAAERLLVAEGYPSVTSRRVEQEAGLGSKLLHYHFGNMDDLFVSMFRRRAEEGMQRFAAAVAAEPSVRTIWEFTLDPIGYNFEFAVVARHRPAVRDEIVAVATRFRSLQTDALRDILGRHDLLDDRLPPELLVLAMTGLNQLMALEDGLGIEEGHGAALVAIERLLDRFD